MRPKSVTCRGRGGRGRGTSSAHMHTHTHTHTHMHTHAHLESTASPVIPDEGVLVQLGGSTVDQVSTALLQQRVAHQLLLAHTIQGWVAQHAHIQVGVPCTWRGVARRGEWHVEGSGTWRKVAHGGEWHVEGSGT